MIVSLLLLLGLAWAADTDPPPADPDTSSTAAPAQDTDAPVDGRTLPVEDTDPPVATPADNAPVDTDTPTDTDAPPPAEAPRTWPGWDTFVGPIAAPPEPEPVPTGASAEAALDSDAPPHDAPGDHGHTDEHDDHGPEAHGEAGSDVPAAAAETAAESAAELTRSMADEQVEPADAPSDPDAPRPYPTYLPFLPTLPLRGWRVGLLLMVVTGVAWGLARLIDPARDWLAPTGILPSIAGAAQQVLRVVALFFALGVIAAVIPANLEPALPWVVLAGALALGWSAREVTPDFVAGIVLAAERKVRPGRWIGTPDITGVVEQVTLRVTWVRDATGRRVAVPNRSFLRHAVVTDRGRWPSVEVVVRIPGAHKPSVVRRIIEDAILVSPWSAPLPPELIREEQDAGLWRVRSRVLHGRFADRFEGALREHVEEVLQTGTGLRAEVSRRIEDE